MIVMLSATLLVTGCHTVSYEGNENSPYYVIPAGSRLGLEREIVIPANRAAVYIQGGQVRLLADVNSYYPYCKFEVRFPRDVMQKVQPDDFVVTRAYQETPLSVRADPQGSDRGGRLVHVVSMDSGDASAIAYATTIWLHSDRQPDVFRMTCAQWGYPPLGGHLSIADIRKTLVGVFTLKITR